MEECYKSCAGRRVIGDVFEFIGVSTEAFFVKGKKLNVAYLKNYVLVQHYFSFTGAGTGRP